MSKTCVICLGPIDVHHTPEGEPYWWDGHNAAPVELGRCCDTCNESVVIPARIKLGIDMYFEDKGWSNKRRTEIVEENTDV